jgi:uncharacterized protein YecE (DUF72 family)
MKYHVGCSGFMYKHWKNVFYPDKLPQKKWFEYYCTEFDTLELNVTFYRFPNETMYHSWYNRSPSGFLFSVKVPRLITHYKKLKDAESLITQFYDVTVNGLKEKLGCILFQFPPLFPYSLENCDRILSSVNPELNNVVEFRHASWWNEDAFNFFKKNKIIFCGMSHPFLPETIIKTAATLYFRFHGNNQLYSSLYQEKELLSFLKNFESAGAKKAFIYFNNDINASAIYNGRFFRNESSAMKKSQKH